MLHRPGGAHCEGEQAAPVKPQGILERKGCTLASPRQRTRRGLTRDVPGFDGHYQSVLGTGVWLQLPAEKVLLYGTVCYAAFPNSQSWSLPEILRD